MLRVKHTLFLLAKHCCCLYQEPPHMTDHESAVFFTNTSSAKMTMSEAGKEEKGDNQTVLVLKVEASNCLELGSEYFITQLGLERPKKSRTEETVIGSNRDLCDIVLENTEEELQCAIRYSPSKAKFELIDTTKNTFLKVTEKTALENESILAFGSSAATVSISDTKTLKLTFWVGPLAGQIREFSSEGEVVVGRTKDCALHIDDSNMSRKQCVLKYEEETGWSLRDGDRKPSQNGTW